MSLSPDDLYDIVCAYADFGDHRTGTDADATTADWLADRLSALGGTVERQPFSFNYFDHDVTLTANGHPVGSLPLYYSCLGRLDTDRVFTARLPLDHEDGAKDPIPALCKLALAEKAEALVLVTVGDTGGLVAINRPSTIVGTLPVVLVAGRDLDRLRHGGLRLSYTAALERRTACNVIARFGDPDAARRIVLTTPFSGWFSCAGERGAGIAVLLGLIESLRETHAFTVIAATGHELMYRGGEIAAATYGAPPDFVLHLGSCVATTEGQLDAVLHAPDANAGPVAEALAPMQVRLHRPDAPDAAESWVGESRCWAGRPSRMLSIAGTSPDFHTPEDTPDRATGPDMLARNLHCIRQAFHAVAG
ncbi:MAG: hypothetical protein RIM72_19985 [Alphaproteobacteria bacterium]